MLLLGALAPCHLLRAQTVISAETRASALNVWHEGTRNHSASGLKGEYLNIQIDGNIGSGLTFSYRQRLNKNTDRTFWDATDWLNVSYQFNPHLSLSAGKQVVAIGGFEYDRAPIDLYTCSEFWGNIACYQLGASATYRLTGNHQLQLQVCNSPFRTWAGNDTYACNLLWMGQHAWWHTLWSVNMLEWAPGHWINYLALGNNFVFSPQCNLNLDVMNRAVQGHTFLGKDASVMAELNWRPNQAWRLYGKYTYDVNRTSGQADWCVMSGTEVHSASMGLETQPLRDHRSALRLFGNVGYSWGTNTGTSPFLNHRQLQIMLGFKLKLNYQI